jgi:hypothetical protein
MHVDDAHVVLSVTERATELADVEHALELADVGPLALEAPQVPSELRADRADFWRACAFAWNPAVRQARRQVLAMRAERRSAGAPGPLELRVDNTDLGGSQRETEVTLTFDLLGVFGLGPVAAARELAATEERRALAELERAVWMAGFEVDRARVDLAVARAKRNALQILWDDADEDAPRIDILDARGWTAPTATGWAKANLHRLEHWISDAMTAEAAARAELAIAAGLPADHPALDQVTAAAAEVARPDDVDWSAVDAPALLAGVPELRDMRLACSVAEARLRRVAAERWPNIRLGPKAVFVPNEVLPGAMLDVELPWPGSVDGRVDAAVQECLAAVDGLEDALVAALARVRERRTELEQAILRLREHAPSVDEASARMWVSARARFDADPSALDMWSLALKDRSESLMMMIEARGQFALALLDYDEARGPRPPRTEEVTP